MENDSHIIGFGLKSEMASHSIVETVRATNDKITKDEFMEMLRNSPKTAMYNKLQFALKFDQVHLTHHIDVNNEEDLIVTCIVGKGDHNLIRLAKMKDDLGFPCGFHLIWSRKSGYITIAAFRSKLANDDRNEIFTLPPNSGLHFTKRYSGSLCLVTSFEYQKRMYLYVGSKNSTGNNYTDLFLEHFKITDEILKSLLNRTMAFKLCSDDPRTEHHGALYDGTHMISIAIGQTENSHDIVNFITDGELMSMSMKLGLSIDNRYQISDSANALKFMNQLNAERDFMTNSSFDHLVKNPEYGISVLKGNFQHSVLTDVLEGLILFSVAKINDICATRPIEHKFDEASLITQKRYSMIKKFKFPRYTVMTMVIRTCIEAGYFGTEHRPDMFDLTSIQSHTIAWGSKWVILPANRKRWLGIVTRCARLIYRTSENLNTNTYLHDCQPIIETIIKHLNSDAEEVEIECRRCPIIAIIGHIGAGKSTLAQRLMAQPNSNFELIEIDDHKETTQHGGRHCNQGVIGTIAHAASQGKTPIVVNGGGIFLTLLTALRTYGVEPSYSQVLIPINLKRYLDGESEAMDLIKNDVTTAVDGRFDRGQYQIGVGWERFTSRSEAHTLFQKVTRGNLIITRKLMAGDFDGAVTEVFTSDTVPDIHSSHNQIYTLKGSFNCGLKAEVVIKGTRYLGHITRYGKTSHSNVSEFFNSLPKVNEGTGVVAKPIGKDGLFVIVPIWKNGHISITCKYRPYLNGTIIERREAILQESVVVKIGVPYMYLI
jgi:hypothetical protein